MNVLAGYTSESRNIQVVQKASNTNGTHAKSTAKTVFKGLVSDPAALTGKNPPAVTALGAMIAVTVLVTMLVVVKVEGFPVVTVSVKVSDDITTRVAVVIASVVAVTIDPLDSIVH